MFHFFHFIRFYSLQKALERHQTKEKEKDAELAFMDGRLRHAHEVTQVVEPKIQILCFNNGSKTTFLQSQNFTYGVYFAATFSILCYFFVWEGNLGSCFTQGFC